MNAGIDFYTKNAEFMAKDRPDIYDYDSALADLTKACAFTKAARTGGVLSFSSYLVVYLGDDEHDDWIFAKKLNSLYQDDEGNSATFNWLDVSNSMAYTPGVDSTSSDD